jgi:DNA-binding transcriptional ArsR family regulator
MRPHEAPRSHQGPAGAAVRGGVWPPKRVIAARPRPQLFRRGSATAPPGRLALLTRLAGCCEPCTVTELSACCPVDLSVVSRHLAILRDAGIVQSERRGKEVYYRVRFDVLCRTFRQIADAIDACGPSSGETEEAQRGD